MARLNEPAAPTESVEALKRRFVRQNRDLARCNSNQSIKIRALETDLSHQLSENASLRVRILHLETELADARTFDVRSNLTALRAKLRSHFDSILVDISELEKKPRRRKSQVASGVASPKRSPQRLEWRNVSTLGEVLASQGGTMPTITEGKHYPRRTIEPSEIQRMIDGDDSPDMPPPRTYYDNEAVTEAKPVEEVSNVGQAPVEPMSAIEIRRRRRDSRVHERSDEENTARPIKAGAKRKLSFSEPKTDEVLVSPRKVLSEKAINTDPIVSPQKPLGNKTTKDVAKPVNIKSIRPVVKELTSTATAKPSTKSTSTTTTATRPRTIISSAEPKPIVKSIQTTTAKSAPAKPSKPLSRPSSAASSHTAEPSEPIVTKAEPKTPGVDPLDLMSPPSTEQHDDHDQNRPGTPPPNGAPPSTSADTAIALANGRGSLRRSRGAVSYAEPKLNVKMRRPGSELADAVVTARKDRPSDAAAVVKLEERDRSASAAPDADAPTNSERVPPCSPLAEKTARVRPPVLTAGKDRTGLDYFEGDPSPVGAPRDEPTSEPAKPTGPSSRSARLSSVAGRDKSLPDLPSELPPASIGASITGTSAGTGRRAASSRRQTLGPGAPPTKTDDESGALAVREVRLRARRAAAAAESVADASGIGVGRSGSVVDLRAERAERILERRRSMML